MAALVQPSTLAPYQSLMNDIDAFTDSDLGPVYESDAVAYGLTAVEGISPEAFTNKVVNHRGYVAQQGFTRRLGANPHGEMAQRGDAGNCMDILSAEIHDDSAVAERDRISNSKPHREITMGGLILKEDHDVPAKASLASKRTAVKSKKRQKSSTNTSDDEVQKNKSRGRPRMDEKIEDAADRRKVQIRIAQRAYRQRKESTIASLQKRVAELEGAMSEMNKSYLRFNDKAVQAGLIQSHPALAETLKETTRNFITLAKVHNPDLEQDLGDIDDIHDAPPERNYDEKNPASQFTSSNRSDAYSKTEAPDLSYTHAFATDWISASIQPKRKRTSETDSSIPGFSTELVRLGKRSTVSRPDQDDLRTLSVPYSISSSPAHSLSLYERSFARRLKRDALEAGFKLLINLDAPQSKIARVFKYAFNFHNREQILALLKSQLLKMNTEGAEDDQLYLAEYSRQSLLGKGSRDLRLEPDRGADALLDESEWFDAYGVERYLQKRGVVFDDISMTAEVEIDIDEVAPNLSKLGGSAHSRSSTSYSTSPTGSSSPGLQEDSGSFHQNSSQIQLIESLIESGLNEYGQGIFPQESVHTDFLDGSGSMMWDTQFAFSNEDVVPAPAGAFVERLNIFESQQKRKRKVAVDLSRLMTMIRTSTICLGWSPGHRRVDVESAFLASLRL